MQLENDQRVLFQQIALLTKQAKSEEALALLARAVREDRLDAEGCEKAGRLIAKLRPADRDDAGEVRAILLGQCTTSWLANNLTSLAWGRGCSLKIREGAYDNVAQELMATTAANDQPHVVILLPWNKRLLHDGKDRSAQQRLDDELDFWRQTWDLVRERTGARIVQVGYDWVTPGHLGHHLSAGPEGDIELIRRLNSSLREALPRGSFFVDLEQISGMAGRERFYDSRRYFWTKQPFSELGAHRLAGHLFAAIRALMTGPKKVLVVDLDNTLWGGVVGETGPLGISLGETPDGEAFRAFQRHIKALGTRGVVLAICSKNNREDALLPFEQNPQMVLGLGDFAHVEANWDPKSAGLRRIAETLNLGLDSFVFFDDNPAEREEIRQALPHVEVVDVPADPADYVRALASGHWFEAVELSTADLQRSELYQQENRRRDLQKTLGSMEDYLRSLDMNGIVDAVDDTTIHRVVQLLAKTNQFNLTTRRHSLEQVQRLLAASGSIGLILNLEDKFGDHGLVSVVIAVPEPAISEIALRIDTWLMSCRVISRTAEHFLFNELISRARELGCGALVGEFIPTKKNSQVADLLDRFGFERIGESDDGIVKYRLSLRDAEAAQTFVRSVTRTRSMSGGA